MVSGNCTKRQIHENCTNFKEQIAGNDYLSGQINQNSTAVEFDVDLFYQVPFCYIEMPL